MDKSYRDFLKNNIRKSIDFSETPQSMGIEPPTIQKPCSMDAKHIPLVPIGTWKSIPEHNLRHSIAQRRSHREYSSTPISMEQLSFLLWATQGIRSEVGRAKFRTVPSAGCRHALETYIAALRIEKLPKAIYRYLPLDHSLIEVSFPHHLEEQLTLATLGQDFCGEAAAFFIWTTIPARMEWRYSEVSYKLIALDAGHVCQNLYLACENIHAGTCAIGAYDQEKMDALIGVDGDEEFTIYAASVGMVSLEENGRRG